MRQDLGRLRDFRTAAEQMARGHSSSRHRAKPRHCRSSQCFRRWRRGAAVPMRRRFHDFPKGFRSPRSRGGRFCQLPGRHRRLRPSATAELQATICRASPERGRPHHLRSTWLRPVHGGRRGCVHLFGYYLLPMEEGVGLAGRPRLQLPIYARRCCLPTRTRSPATRGPRDRRDRIPSKLFPRPAPQRTLCRLHRC